MVQRRSHKGKIFYGCSQYPKCDMALWNEPVNQFCTTCGSIMVKKKFKTGKEFITCSNPDCPSHPKRRTAAAKGEEGGSVEKSVKRRRSIESGESD